VTYAKIERFGLIQNGDAQSWLILKAFGTWFWHAWWLITGLFPASCDLTSADERQEHP
jgi:hypothetical protein